MNIIFPSYISLLNISLTALSLVQQLDLLEPVFEPEPVSFSFNTPAWYALGVFILLVLLYLALLQLIKYKKNGYRRDALKVLSTLNPTDSEDVNTILNEVRILLKQVAIYRYDRLQVASLFGKDWLSFLESKGKDTPFSNYSILIDQTVVLNSEKENQDVKGLVEVSKKWIKTHA